MDSWADEKPQPQHDRSPLSPWAACQRELAGESQLIRDDIEQHDPYTDSVPYQVRLLEEIPQTELEVSPTEKLYEEVPLTEQLREIIESDLSKKDEQAGPPPRMSGGPVREVTCVDGEAKAARPVSDLDANPNAKEEKVGAPATPAQHQMGGEAMHIDISPPPATPRTRAKREAGGEGDQSPAQQTKASVATPDEPTDGLLMLMLQQLLIGQNETKQYMGHIHARVDQTDSRVTELEKAQLHSDQATRDRINGLTTSIEEQGRARTTFEQALAARLGRLEAAQKRAADLAAQAHQTANSAQETAIRAATTVASPQKVNGDDVHTKVVIAGFPRDQPRELIENVCRPFIGRTALGKSLLSSSASSPSGQVANIEPPTFLEVPATSRPTTPPSRRN